MQTEYRVTWNFQETIGGNTTQYAEGPETYLGTGTTLAILKTNSPPAANGTKTLLGVEIMAVPVPGMLTQGGGIIGCSGGCSSGKEGMGFSASPGRAEFWNNGVNMAFSLGMANAESSGGMLRVTSQEPSEDLASPVLLQFVGDLSRVSLSTNQDGSLQQIDGMQVRVKVVPDTYEYDLEFYINQEGGYAETAFVTYTIQNPNGSTNSNTLRSSSSAAAGRLPTSMPTWATTRGSWSRATGCKEAA